MNEARERRWRVETIAKIDCYGPANGYQIMDGDDVVVEMFEGNGWTHSQMRAMLATMAAAPQMLEALEDIDSAGLCECCCGETPCRGTCTATMIKEAIRAATGQGIKQPRPAVPLSQRSDLKIFEQFYDLRHQMDDLMSEMSDRWLTEESEDD